MSLIIIENEDGAVSVLNYISYFRHASYGLVMEEKDKMNPDALFTIKYQRWNVGISIPLRRVSLDYQHSRPPIVLRLAGCQHRHQQAKKYSHPSHNGCIITTNPRKLLVNSVYKSFLYKIIGFCVK